MKNHWAKEVPGLNGGETD